MMIWLKITRINLVWLIRSFLDLFYVMNYKILKGKLKRLGENKISPKTFYYTSLICISDRDLDPQKTLLTRMADSSLNKINYIKLT